MERFSWRIEIRKLYFVMLALTLSVVTLITSVAPAIAAKGIVMRLIARGASIHGANGMVFDENENLYIASYFGPEIVVMNPLNGKIIGRLGSDVGVEGPDDLTCGPDGSLYWTDLAQGLVGRMSPDGTVTKQFVAPGVNPITFSDDGRLFVALDFMGAGLYELDPDLVAPPQLLIPPSLGFLNGFDFGPDGRLYGPLFADHKVISIDVDNPSDITSVSDGFGQPAAAKFDARGRLRVLDQTGEVFQVNVVTGAKTVIATLAPGLDNLAFDSRNNLYVSNANDGSVTRILPSGQGRVLSPAGMIIPGGIAVLPGSDGRDALFVADMWTLREFDGLTGRDTGFTSAELVRPGLIAPMTVSADAGRLIISSWAVGKVQVWNPETANVVEEYTVPYPLNAIAFQSDLLISSPILGLVWASTLTPVFSNPNGIIAPLGLASDEDTLFLADYALGSVGKSSSTARHRARRGLSHGDLSVPRDWLWIQTVTCL